MADYAGSKEALPSMRGRFLLLSNNGTYRRYALARTVSLFGSGMATIALAFGALRISGSPTALGLVLMCSAIPQALLMPAAGVLCDRLPRFRLIVLVDVVVAVSQFGVAASLLWYQSLVYLLVGAAITGSGSAIFAPAYQRVLRDLVPRQDLVTATAALRMSFSVTKFVAPALGGWLVGMVGPASVITLDGASFLLAALLLRVLAMTGNRQQGRQTNRVRATADFLQGWSEFRSHGWLIVLVLQGAVGTLVWLIGFQLLGPTEAYESLGGASSWGLISSSFAGGMITGSFLLVRWQPSRTGVAMCVATGVMAFPMFALALNWDGIWLICVATAMTGVALDVSIVSFTVLLQTSFSGEIQGRIFGLSNSGQLAVVPLAYVGAGSLASHIGLRPLFVGAGLALLVAGFLPLALSSIWTLDNSVSRTEVTAR
ncbi:MAG TPA: MFS transporter [Mycobacteriales bacterium]|nr:MFS transporter [Mycobacteriales bacterium]